MAKNQASTEKLLQRETKSKCRQAAKMSQLERNQCNKENMPIIITVNVKHHQKAVLGILSYAEGTHTSSVTWLALSVICSTDMSSILLVSILADLPAALSSTLWGLRVRGERLNSIRHSNKTTRNLQNHNFPKTKDSKAHLRRRCQSVREHIFTLLSFLFEHFRYYKISHICHRVC